MRAHYDNPAGRLAAVLYGFQRDSGVTLGAAFGISPVDDRPSSVLFRIMELETLVRNSREQIEALPEDEDPAFLIVPFEKVEQYVGKLIRNALANASTLRASDMASRISSGLIFPEQEILFGLEACSRALRRWKKEPSIPEDQFMKLIEQVRSLVDEVVGNDALSEDAKAYLIARLREVEGALLGSRLTGFTDLEASLDRLTGALVRRPDIREPRLLAKIGRFFQSLVAVASGTAAISGATTATVR